jgi:hypothetical protein
MSAEAQVVIEIWDSVRDFIPANKRLDIAENILKSFADYGFEANDLHEIIDEDKDLEEAFEIIFSDQDDETLEDE